MTRDRNKFRIRAYPLQSINKSNSLMSGKLIDTRNSLLPNTILIKL